MVAEISHAAFNRQLRDWVESELSKLEVTHQSSILLPPISRSLFARCGIPQRSTCFFPKVGKKVKVRGIPHLAKTSEIWGTPRFVEGTKWDGPPVISLRSLIWTRRSESSSGR
jgi:hypothetical protein